MRLTVLIVGGYGTFGGRLAALLAEDTRLRLLIGGRSLDKAGALIARLPKGAELVPVIFDRDSGTAGAIRALGVDVLVDATGPFQNYGDDPFRLVRETIAARAHYLDLADSSAFVAGIAQFDAAAREQGVFVLSGVSSFPVLSVAAMRELTRGMSCVTSLTGGIAPSPRAGIGGNVVQAIMSYAGQSIQLTRDGRTTTASALTESTRYTIAPPGGLPLRNTRFSLIDVPELMLLSAAQPGLQSVWMGGGTRPEILLRALNLLAWLVRLRLLPSVGWLAGFGHWLMSRMHWGEHRGGMFVEVAGTRDGATLKRSWHLVAEGDDGPFIPSMAIAIIVGKLLDGTQPAIGARPALDALSLADYEALFRSKNMAWGMWEDGPEPDGPLYREVLGEAWERLPGAVRCLHDWRGGQVVAGEADVIIGSGWLARIVHRVMGFPAAGQGVPVSVNFSERDGVETWTRDFAGRRFSSDQSAGIGRNERLIVERFGPVRVALAVLGDETGLRLVIRSWTLFGMPLPLALGPTTEAREHEADGRFYFDVSIGHRLTGLIVRYRGWLIRR
jgi:saccharopine dehydrogenase-like NADP-dependent oxidoreductase